MSTADSWHTELREERREPKDLSKGPHHLFAGLHERAILPEATGRSASILLNSLGVSFFGFRTLSSAFAKMVDLAFIYL